MLNNRKELLIEIENMRNSKIITYIGGDRHSVSTRIAPDILPVLFKHLNKFPPNSKIDFYLFTKGGDVHTALRLVQLIYEFTDNFSVIVPHKAYSSGTLICLGASEIVMTKMAELSPIDPNITSIFNPSDFGNANAKLAINVEDVYSYFNVARDVLKLTSDEAIVKVFTELTDKVHPLAIGSIQRTYMLIRSIARKLLSMHLGPAEEEKIAAIISYLTEDLFSHSYMISRKEAMDSIGLPVVLPEKELERKIGKLYEAYKADLLLEKPFYPQETTDNNGRFSVCSGIIESSNRTDAYTFDGILHGTDDVQIIEQSWREL